MRAACIILLGLLCSALGPSAAVAQSPPRLSLRAPSVTTTEQFSEVTGLAELSPGTILVADARERRLVVVDLATNRSREISRIGSGPQEFRSVSENLLRRPGGGAWVVDFAQRRLLPVNPDGSLEDAITFPLTSMLLKASDATGRVYGEVMIFRDPGRRLSDSVMIVRWAPPDGRVDTLRTVDVGRAGMVVRRGEAFRAFRTTTSWAVTPAGAWIGLQGGSYRLSAWLDGRETRAVTLPFVPIPVTSADRSAWQAAQEQQRPTVIGQPGGSGSGMAGSGPPPGMAYQFPDHYPVFEADAPLFVAPDGHLWIERLLGVRQAAREYDVIHPEGRITARVVMPAGARVVGFGAGVIYLAVKDADDLLTIQRHPLPSLSAGRP